MYSKKQFFKKILTIISVITLTAGFVVDVLATTVRTTEGDAHLSNNIGFGGLEFKSGFGIKLGNADDTIYIDLPYEIISLDLNGLTPAGSIIASVSGGRLGPISNGLNGSSISLVVQDNISLTLGLENAVGIPPSNINLRDNSQIIFSSVTQGMSTLENYVITNNATSKFKLEGSALFSNSPLGQTTPFASVELHDLLGIATNITATQTHLTGPSSKLVLWGGRLESNIINDYGSVADVGVYVSDGGTIAGDIGAADSPLSKIDINHRGITIDSTAANREIYADVLNGGTLYPQGGRTIRLYGNVGTKDLPVNSLDFQDNTVFFIDGTDKLRVFNANISTSGNDGLGTFGTVGDVKFTHAGSSDPIIFGRLNNINFNGATGKELITIADARPAQFYTQHLSISNLTFQPHQNLTLRPAIASQASDVTISNATLDLGNAKISFLDVGNANVILDGGIKIISNYQDIRESSIDFSNVAMDANALTGVTYDLLSDGSVPTNTAIDIAPGISLNGVTPRVSSYDGKWIWAGVGQAGGITYDAANIVPLGDGVVIPVSVDYTIDESLTTLSYNNIAARPFANGIDGLLITSPNLNITIGSNGNGFIASTDVRGVDLNGFQGANITVNNADTSLGSVVDSGERGVRSTVNVNGVTLELTGTAPARAHGGIKENNYSGLENVTLSNNMASKVKISFPAHFDIDNPSFNGDFLPAAEGLGDFIVSPNATGHIFAGNVGQQGTGFSAIRIEETATFMGQNVAASPSSGNYGILINPYKTMIIDSTNNPVNVEGIIGSSAQSRAGGKLKIKVDNNNSVTILNRVGATNTSLEYINMIFSTQNPQPTNSVIFRDSVNASTIRTSGVGGQLMFAPNPLVTQFGRSRNAFIKGTNIKLGGGTTMILDSTNNIIDLQAPVDGYGNNIGDLLLRGSGTPNNINITSAIGQIHPLNSFTIVAPPSATTQNVWDFFTLVTRTINNAISLSSNITVNNDIDMRDAGIMVNFGNGKRITSLNGNFYTPYSISQDGQNPSGFRIEGGSIYVPNGFVSLSNDINYQYYGQEQIISTGRGIDLNGHNINAAARVNIYSDLRGPGNVILGFDSTLKGNADANTGILLNGNGMTLTIDAEDAPRNIYAPITSPNATNNRILVRGGDVAFYNNIGLQNNPIGTIVSASNAIFKGPNIIVNNFVINSGATIAFDATNNGMSVLGAIDGNVDNVGTLLLTSSAHANTAFGILINNPIGQIHPLDSLVVSVPENIWNNGVDPSTNAQVSFQGDITVYNHIDFRSTGAQVNFGNGNPIRIKSLNGNFYTATTDPNHANITGTNINKATIELSNGQMILGGDFSIRGTNTSIITAQHGIDLAGYNINSYAPFSIYGDLVTSSIGGVVNFNIPTSNENTTATIYGSVGTDENPLAEIKFLADNIFIVDATDAARDIYAPIHTSGNRQGTLQIAGSNPVTVHYSIGTGICPVKVINLNDSNLYVDSSLGDVALYGQITTSSFGRGSLTTQGTNNVYIYNDIGNYLGQPLFVPSLNINANTTLYSGVINVTNIYIGAGKTLTIDSTSGARAISSRIDGPGAITLTGANLSHFHYPIGVVTSLTNISLAEANVDFNHEAIESGLKTDNLNIANSRVSNLMATISGTTTLANGANIRGASIIIANGNLNMRGTILINNGSSITGNNGTILTGNVSLGFNEGERPTFRSSGINLNDYTLTMQVSAHITGNVSGEEGVLFLNADTDGEFLVTGDLSAQTHFRNNTNLMIQPDEEGTATIFSPIRSDGGVGNVYTAGHRVNFRHDIGTDNSPIDQFIPRADRTVMEGSIQGVYTSSRFSFGSAGRHFVSNLHNLNIRTWGTADLQDVVIDAGAQTITVTGGATTLSGDITINAIFGANNQVVIDLSNTLVTDNAISSLTYNVTGGTPAPNDTILVIKGLTKQIVPTLTGSAQGWTRGDTPGTLVFGRVLPAQDGGFNVPTSPDEIISGNSILEQKQSSGDKFFSAVAHNASLPQSMHNVLSAVKNDWESLQEIQEDALATEAPEVTSNTVGDIVLVPTLEAANSRLSLIHI